MFTRGLKDVEQLQVDLVEHAFLPLGAGRLLRHLGESSEASASS
jgi:hypothetical protein